jgi:predicted kinase
MKTVIIPVGLPGAGKSTYAEGLKEDYCSKDFVKVSADDYFVALGNGEYAFDPRKLGEAHKSCQNLFKQALEKGVHMVYVDNTNLMREHRKFYVDLAREYGYVVEYVVFPKPKNVAELDTLATRQIHGVPWQGMLRMWKNMELPE